MRKAVADHCRDNESKINIKSTTTEKLGWIGKAEGMAATAVVLLGR